MVQVKHVVMRAEEQRKIAARMKQHEKENEAGIKGFEKEEHKKQKREIQRKKARISYNTQGQNSSILVMGLPSLLQSRAGDLATRSVISFLQVLSHWQRCQVSVLLLSRPPLQ